MNAVPTGFHPSAQGCAARATLGQRPKPFLNPEGGCLASARATNRPVFAKFTGLRPFSAVFNAIIGQPPSRSAKTTVVWVLGDTRLGKTTVISAFRQRGRAKRRSFGRLETLGTAKRRSFRGLEMLVGVK